MRSARYIILITSIMLVLSMGISGFVMAKTVINYWGMKQAEVELLKAQEAALKEFYKMYPDVEIKVTVFPYGEYRDKLLVAAASGNPPDVAVLDQIWNPEFAAAGLIEPLDDFISTSKAVRKELYFSGAWDSAVYKGKVYGIPFDVGVWSLVYYNKDMFTKVGLDPNKPPVYWDEILEYGKKLTRDSDGDGVLDQWGLALWAGDEATQCITDAFIFSNGGSVLNEDFTKAVLDQPKAIEAMKYFKSLQEINPEGAVNRTSEDAFRLFTAGRIGMHLYGEWGEDTIRARAPQMNWALTNFPKPRGGQSIGTFGGWNMAIFKKAKNKEMAWKFIEFFTSAAVNEKVASLTPANKEAATAFLKKKRSFPDIIYSQLTTALYRPIFPHYPELSEIQRQATEAILLGKKTVEQAMKDATRQIDALLQKQK